MTVGRGDARRAAYALAGVDVAAGDRTVDLIAAAVASTRRPEVVGGLGGYGGVVRLPVGVREPLLVASTDGVGTKTAIAAALRRYRTIGIDLVAMTADDVVCTGAAPLLLVDYVAVGRLDPDVVAELVEGVAAGCREAGCALVGGETAEHPRVMLPEAFDVSATCVGVVERDELLDGTAARPGDVVLGLPSSGLHANGFSLVRHLVADHDIPYERPYQEQLERSIGDAAARMAIEREPGLALVTIGDVLLEPTTIYAPRLLAARRVLRAAGRDVRGLAHVTGGGLAGNAPRAVPAGLGVQVDPGAWPMPSVMRLLGALGGIDDDELRATFNGGIGMVVVVAPGDADAARAALAAERLEPAVIGRVASVAELGGRRYVEAPLAW